MSIDADMLANQVNTAYKFMEILHSQAISMIKDVETQLAIIDVRCIKPGGYRFTPNPLPYSLDRPQPVIADYYALYFTHSEHQVKSIPLKEGMPIIAFVKVTLREHRMLHPEVRSGIVTSFLKLEGRDGKWPVKFQDYINDFTNKALTLSLIGRMWAESGSIDKDYQDSYVSARIRGGGRRLADLPNSEAIAEFVVDPIKALLKEANGL